MMRYWLLRPDAQDADGPFEISELRSRPGFGPDSVVAPEGAQSVDAWRPADTYADLRVVFSSATPRSAPPPRPPGPRAPASPITEAAPQPGKSLEWYIGRVTIFAGLIVGGLAAVFAVQYWLITSRSANVAQSQAEAQVPPPAKPSSPGHEAIEFVKRFPIRSRVMPRCPRRIEDLPDGLGKTFLDIGGRFEEISSWPRVKTIGEGFDCARYFQVLMSLPLLVERMKSTPDAVAARLRTAGIPDALRRYEQQITVAWTADHSGGSIYRVSAAVTISGLKLTGERSEETRNTYSWLVDLEQGTIKPLTKAAWGEIAYRDAFAWAKKEAARYPDCARISRRAYDALQQGRLPSGGQDLNCPIMTTAEDKIDVSRVAPAYPAVLAKAPVTQKRRQQQPPARGHLDNLPGMSGFRGVSGRSIGDSSP